MGEAFGLPRPEAPTACHHTEVEVSELGLDGMIFLRPSRLALIGRHLALDLAEDVLDADQVLAGPLHLPLRRESPAPEAGGPRRLLQEEPELLRLGVDQLVHASLLDD